MGGRLADRSPQSKGRFVRPTKNIKMIILVCAKLKDIYTQGRNFNWTKPDRCPRCGSVKVWGHGYVRAYFDDFYEGLFLRRFRCPDCTCVIRMKPKGYFNRFHSTIDTIRSCLYHRLLHSKWDPNITKSRQRHWLLALKRKTMAFFGLRHDLLNAFDRLIEMGKIPVSRSI